MVSPATREPLRRRRPTSAQRRAARDRDHGRCRYPGCESRRTDLHHIQYWSNGGPTPRDNLTSLCPPPPHISSTTAATSSLRGPAARSPSTYRTAPCSQLVP